MNASPSDRIPSYRSVFHVFGSITLQCLVVTLLILPAQAVEPFRITVLDRSNDWPVPLVELQTTHFVRFVSDNSGMIAIDAPDLMGVDTWFEVKGHGYRVQADGFGFQGVRLKPTPGQSTTLYVDRTLPAKRLGRITGGGLFCESQKLGEQLDWKESGIFGCDSVQVATHRGRLIWVWGDTTLPGYPLGIFDTLGASTELKPLSKPIPPIKLSYGYYRDELGKIRGVAKMPGSGPTWITGMVSLPALDGQPKLVASYMKIEPPLTVYEKGLCIWNDESAKFEQHRVLWKKPAKNAEKPATLDSQRNDLLPEGHGVLWHDENAVEWMLFCDPFPKLKMPATFEAWNDPKQWIAIAPQSKITTKSADRPKDTPMPASRENKNWQAEIEPHRGSIAWNAYRKHWVTVFTQIHGSSELGELWYAESPSPFGPWNDAVKIVTHDNYSFYNPRIHPEWTEDDPSILLFEGTFTEMFANRPQASPRNEYNQVLYRLDLKELAEK